jgi:hypothetical protein
LLGEAPLQQIGPRLASPSGVDLRQRSLADVAWEPSGALVELVFEPKQPQISDILKIRHLFTQAMRNLGF